MKTNIVMNSSDRELFGVVIRQETKTGFLNVSDLQLAYTIEGSKHGWSEKNLSMILSTNQNIERCYYILEKQGVIKLNFLSFMEQVENEGILKVLKSLGAYKTTGKGKTKTVWCNPYVWVLIALEMNPIIYASVVMWLTDKLILNRIEAGNFYKDFSRAISKFNPDYAKVAKALNYIVFNRHEPGIRNTASEKQLNELIDLEKKMAFAIDMEFIKSEKELIDNLRKLWYNKWYEKIL